MFCKKIFLILFIFSICHHGNNLYAGVDYLTVLSFGDSITQGLARDSDGVISGITVPPRGARIDWWGYEIQLETMVEDFLGVGTSSVYNWGYHGLRSNHALQCDNDWDCIDDVLDSRPADIILILLGSNDLYAGISSTATRDNLSIMIEKSTARNVEPIMGTLTPNTSGTPLFNASLIEEYYNPMIRNLCLEKGITVADHYPAMVSDWELFTSGDGLHLNDEDGNRVLAETWFGAILKSRLFAKTAMLPFLHLLLNRQE